MGEEPDPEALVTVGPVLVGSVAVVCGGEVAVEVGWVGWVGCAPEPPEVAKT
ncbi:MAG TPA: hypothetical protein VKV21_02685 [Solirubrobacteraceae bacterium]|nr:hypothetical protein [Solirubrobacteraceae bacterium]